MNTIPGESQEEFQRFAEEMVRSCRPADAIERMVVDRMITHGWRLRRLQRAEDQVPIFARHTLFRIRRLIAAAQRSCRESAAELRRLQAKRPAMPVGMVQLFEVQ